MATIKEIQDKADAEMTAIIADNKSIQENWILTHRGYWQGIRTPQAIPVEGVDTTPDKNVKPVSGDEAASWNEAGVPLPTTLSCSVEIFTHEGPKGKGFSVISWIKAEGKIFRRVTGFGDEFMPTTAWQEYIEDKF